MRRFLAAWCALTVLAAASLILLASPAPADDGGKRLRGEAGGREARLETGGGLRLRERERKTDHGNETTGEIAGWLFGAANLPAALSLLARGARRIPRIPTPLGERIAAANRAQKRLLMRLHFYLNPLALGVAAVHFLLSNCDTTALPEWSLGLISVLVASGLVMKWRSASPRLRRAVLHLHTHPAPALAAFAVLLAGHLLLD